MKRKLDISFIGDVSIHKYGMCLMAIGSNASSVSLDKLIYNALAENEGTADGEKEEYYGRADVTVHIELIKDPVLVVEAE